MWFQRALTLLVMFATPVFSAGVAYSDWTIPLSFAAGGVHAKISLGIQNGASDGYDAGKDTPSIGYSDEKIYAVYPHPEWGLTAGKAKIDGFVSDVRGQLPQEFVVEVRSTQSNVTVSWPSSQLPSGVNLSLRDPFSGTTLDMSKSSSYTFNSSGTTYRLSVIADEGDSSPPAPPQGLTAQERKDAIFLSWDSNFESDIKGYKVHYRNEAGNYRRTTDVKNVTNFSLLNLFEQQLYFVSLTAYDADGNESEHTEVVSAGFNVDRESPLSPVGLSAYISGASSLKLSWSENAEEDLSEYSVYYGTVFGQYNHKAKVGKKTSYSVPAPVEGATYFFTVTATDMAGNESEKSTPTSIKFDLKPPEITSVETPDQETPDQETPDGETKSISLVSAYIALQDQNGNNNQDVTTRQEKTAENKTEKTSDPEVVDAAAEGPEADGDVVAPEDLALKAVEEKSSGGLLRHKILFDDHPWKLMTVPLRVSPVRPFKKFAALGAELNQLTGWDVQKQEYVPLKSVRPGTAFWLRAGQGFCVVEGKPVAEDVFSMTLDKGWNLLGNPYLESLPSTQIQLAIGDKVLSLDSALSEGWLGAEYRVFEGGKLKNKVIGNNFRILPWQGYWLHAKTPCQLLLSKDHVSEINAEVPQAVSAVKVKDALQ